MSDEQAQAREAPVEETGEYVGLFLIFDVTDRRVVYLEAAFMPATVEAALQAFHAAVPQLTRAGIDMGHKFDARLVKFWKPDLNQIHIAITPDDVMRAAKAAGVAKN